MSGLAVRMLRAGNPSPMTLDGTRTFVAGWRRPVVIDPGPESPAHLQALLALLDGVTPAAILLTHAHGDHAGNAAPLSAATGAPIWMGRGARRLPFDSRQVSRWLQDGDRIEVDATIIQVIATPGHTADHMAYLHVDPSGSGTLFAGDFLLGSGDTTLVAHPEGDIASYLESLARVETLSPTVIYPAHGPLIERPLSVLRRYRAHRLERIEQVKAARLAHPEAPVESLVASVYGGDLDPRLADAAHGSVRAILQFLGMDRGG